MESPIFLKSCFSLRNLFLFSACLPDRLCDVSPLLTYTYRISELTCQEWDEETEVWSSGGCQLEAGSTPTTAKFKSNLFGSLGAGLTVAPNTINFNEVFNDLDEKLIENAAVVGTVIGVLILYIPFLLLCRNFDKKDKLKV